ncbi:MULTISPECIES: class I SAM-dependent methyltransferase [Corallococcus]|uniref:class I SAM-dependent methyltransferase n=1 Tax=Corallococcus TaxID=83461 RepID=UPI0011800550|nr:MULTISPECIES: class I SAM-dependent methyltransferase [Corallococcus]NBD08325.1 methyltransferase domain-containing protein [Corallococcus silvisoli]TSC34282.1 class I SAM-dependent methyltransferase [Corallococcus sp. Z5C101001]
MTTRHSEVSAKERPIAFDWTAERGAKWQAQLDGMEAMLAPVDEPLIQALRLDAPRRIADVGCGGGRTTLELLRRAPAGSVVHGFDISQPLIETARARAQREELPAHFTRADVATTPLSGAAYERLTSRFGVMFFDDPPAAFHNLASWLAPGGRFAFAVWGRPADNPWVTTVREAVAEVVELPAPDPDAPGPFRYGQADKLRLLLGRAGFDEVEVSEWRGGLAIGGGLAAAEAAAFALAAFSVAERLSETDEAGRGAAMRSLTTRFARHENQGVVRLDACVHIVTGTRPG